MRNSLCAASIIVAFHFLTQPLAIAQDPTTERLDRERLERDLTSALAPIRSLADMRQYLDSMPVDSPLNALSSNARNKFLQSLFFTDKGLASFDYSMLRTELTATQIYRLLSLFGVQRSTQSIPNLRIESESDERIMAPISPTDPEAVIDYDNDACVAKATCQYASNSICIGDNG